jgi:hypothetical protein
VITHISCLSCVCNKCHLVRVGNKHAAGVRSPQPNVRCGRVMYRGGNFGNAVISQKTWHISNCFSAIL